MLPHADGECRDGDVDAIAFSSEVETESPVLIPKFASHRSNLTQNRGSLA
jgi:hypothetical protein